LHFMQYAVSAILSSPFFFSNSSREQASSLTNIIQQLAIVFTPFPGTRKGQNKHRAP
jgi:hypothetical protein